MENCSRYSWIFSLRFFSGSGAFSISRPKDDVRGPLRSHHGDFGHGPGEDRVRPQFPVAHGHVSASVSLAQDQGDLGDRGFGIGEEDLGPVADDAAELLGLPGQKGGGVDQGEKGDVEAVAEANEPGGFVGSVDIQGAGQKL